MNWLSAEIVLIVFPLIKESLPNENPGILFLFFSFYAFVAFLVYIKLVIDIKDKSENDIYMEYKEMTHKIKCFEDWIRLVKD